ncbi:MAG: kelch repeat-containing protein, partial [Promethearchaeota archaeon]
PTSCIDAEGNLWLFGGYGSAETGIYNWLNDLWKYNITSGVWTWMAGNKTDGVSGVYGTKGIPNIENFPGNREDSDSWMDAEGNLWLFGGWGEDSVSGDNGYYNDLWRYNISSGVWTWMSGNKTFDVYGVYGVKGTPDVNNYPGSRIGAVSWTDIDGDLWLFGGSGSAETGNGGSLNDVWKYNTSSGMWTWMAGNKTTSANGVYGIKGISYVTVFPGNREDSASWMDAEGNLWLFGGWGEDTVSGDNGYYNDLWKYNMSSGLWTWMAGNKTFDVYGVYGIKGIPDINNYPGSRIGAVSWTDIDGNLWLFGGSGSAETGIGGSLNDVWKYNTSSGMWTWMAGNKTSSVNGVYGIKGTPDAQNYPGSRYGSTSWTDVEGNLWLFGGRCYDSGIKYLNDLWRYEISSGVWTWIAGNNTYNLNGVYGIKGTPDVNNYPSSRQCPFSWTDTEGDLWLFGGYGYAETGGVGCLNDLWRYEISSGVWTWMAGNNTYNLNGVYGIKGTPDATNYPGSRERSISWSDADGDLWLFGGYGYAETGGLVCLNDVWKYNTSSGMWTWMAGNKTANANGVYGIKGIPDVKNYPGGRGAPTSCIDAEGNLWLFGGYGSAETGIYDWLNDLWKMEIIPESEIPPPSKVTGLTIVSTTETSIYLSWDASLDTDVIIYMLYRNGVNIANITVPNTSYNDTGLEPGTSYNYQISAVDSFQEGELSDVVTGTTNQEDTGAESIPGYDILIIMGVIGIILLRKILLRKSPKENLNNLNKC